jgi:ABC-type sugar transport system ATPase subunit
MGAGRTELCRAIFGLDPVSSGSVEVAGRPLALRNPREAVAAGVALIPEDRQRTGLARDLPIGWNVTLANLDAVSPGGVIRHPEEERVTREAIDRRISSFDAAIMGALAVRRSVLDALREDANALLAARAGFVLLP